MDKKIKKLLQTLIDQSETKGLSSSDVNAAKEYLQHHEFGLSLDTIVTQMYEYNVQIDQEFYLQIEQIANMMNIPESEYSYIKKLIGDALQRP